MTAPRSPSLVERTDQAFAPGGPLARIFEAFEPRAGQRQLAAAVADVFTRGGTLVAEAGTGTGKTLAYLVPAVLAGKRVLISTGTRTLQDQIFYKDLPELSRALDREIRAAYMKGRTNYLCLHRFHRLLEMKDALEDAERTWLTRVSEWAGETETGDRGEIDDLPDDLPFWSELSATSEQCLGRECHHFGDCFVTRMRERAADADVVIVNHHLLCADAAIRQGDFDEVIPGSDLIVVDEAHQLEDVVTQYFGVSLSTFRIEDFVRDAARSTGALGRSHPLLATALSRATIDVQQSARVLFEAARQELRQRESGGDRMTMTTATATRLQHASHGLEEALARIRGLIRAESELPPEIVAVGTRASALTDDLKVLVAPDDPSYVHFIEVRGRGLALRAAPIDVGDRVRDEVLGDRTASVLTSATMTVEASFEYMLGRLGLGHATTLRLASEFDFTAQAILYLPPEMPDPRSPDFNRAAAWVITELLDRTQGRAFLLFTSYAAMKEVYALVDRRVSWPLLMQGTASRRALLRDFRATPNAVLLATASFWQGVDVAGEALSCVVIDRLPFASPGDPLVAARIAAIERRGGQPFHEYQVPFATLTLLQGLGRLIRTRSDRGVLAVLDPRLTRMRYGARFLASLPSAPITDDLSAVARFLAAGPVLNRAV
jgi:ATP-dependent DNA helicase DinG